MIEITATNAPNAYVEAYWKMKNYGVQENSRNGPVLSMPCPTMLEILAPQERVLFNPERNCNPFFHVMETIWMFSGDNHVGFPAKFNSTYVNYAEADGSVHGAYGKRWRDHFQPKEIGPRYRMDQIQLAIAMLKKNYEDRRVVLSMWDTAEDLGASKRDLPCNTHIYLRGKKEKDKMAGYPWTLDMTVCNRSNDLLWGMLGANIVHMTYLHELIAIGAGMNLGTYRVMTNNLHIYTESPVAKEFMKAPPLRHDFYGMVELPPADLLQDNETVEQFFEDCENFCSDFGRKDQKAFNTVWMNTVATWMYHAYMERLEKKGTGMDYVERIDALDWRLACKQWIERKTQSSATSTAP